MSCFKAIRVNPSQGIIFRQLFDTTSSTYTYLLADPKSKEAVLIDPVLEKVERDVLLIKELDLDLKYVINTHVHADHVTGSGKIKETLKTTKSVISEDSEAKADVHVKHGDLIHFGSFSVECRSTPGHTNGCMTYVCHAAKMIFTGDALLIRGCGRTDFQQGDSSKLYDSVHKQIFSLPDDYIIYPGHDYKGLTSSSVGEEKEHNPRLTQTKEDFIITMKNLNLAYPKLIDVAVPANMLCGFQETN